MESLLLRISGVLFPCKSAGLKVEVFLSARLLRTSLSLWFLFSSALPSAGSNAGESSRGTETTFAGPCT